MNKLGYNAIAAIGGVTIIICWALWLGYDGVLLMSGIAVVSGLGGYPLTKKAYQNYKDNLESPIANAILNYNRGKPPGK